MAALSQIIFYSMVTLILVFSALIILILALTFTKSSSEVMSTNTAPVANLSQDELLSCFLTTAVSTAPATLTQVSVTWEKENLLVYKFAKGAPDLGNQNAQYKDRTQLFPTQLVSGNASLLLRNVKSKDGGVYTCTISSSGGGGKVSIDLRTAAFSAPTFNILNGSLRAFASGWFPEPSVTWEDAAQQLLNGTRSSTQNSSGMFSVASTLPSFNISSTYTCRINNSLVAAVSEATVTDVTEGSTVLATTDFFFSAAPSLLASVYLNVMTSVLCIY